MKLHVESVGSGPVVLLLHGVAGSERTFAWLALEGRTVVRFDFRGHGASDRAPGSYRLEHYVADALSVLEDVGPAFLAGHSLGGVTAWTIAQQRPELVRGLFMEDPPLYRGEPAEHARNPGLPTFKLLRDYVRRVQAAGASPEEVTRELAAEIHVDGRRLDEIQTPESLESRGYALTHVDPELLDRVIDGSLLASADVVSEVSVPTFVLAADDAFGAAFTTAHEQRLAASHPAIEVMRLPGASHIIHDERDFRDEWLRQLSSRA